MKTVSGALIINKTERKLIRLVLEHCKQDISFSGGGTFSKGDAENTADKKEIEKAKRGIELIEWIINEGSF